MLSHEDIMTFKNNLCTFSSKVVQDKFVLTLMEVRKAKRTNQQNLQELTKCKWRYDKGMRTCIQCYYISY